jgi:hypothetical protein
MIALLSVMGKASRSRRRKWANKAKGVPVERAEIISIPAATPSIDQDARDAGCSDSSSSENSTGIISFVATLPFRSFPATRSC